MKKLVLLTLAFLLGGCQSSQVERASVEELEASVSAYNREQFLEIGTIYEIFPIAYADSNGDGHGDLQGVISVLDYLNDGDPTTTDDLGIGAIWFTPLYPSNSYHHYDVIDYKDIDPKFGTLEDFDALVEACNERGIKVVMDMVFNHSAYENEWFQKALEGDKKYQAYYHMVNELPKEDYPKRSYWYESETGMYYYGSFWERMPELDGDNEDVRNELKSILDFWMDRGVKGFRYDAAKHMYNADEYPVGTPVMEMTKQFWLEMEDYVKSKNEDTFLVAEVWLDTAKMAPYASSFDSLFNFDVGPMIFDVIKSGKNKNFVQQYLENIEVLTKRNPSYIDAPFLTNHDQTRAIHELNNNLEYAKQAAMIYLTLPGLPTVYYGEELGMQGMKPDEQIREPMKWQDECGAVMACWEAYKYNQNTASVQTQMQDANSILKVYQNVIQYRASSDVLKKGDLEVYDMGNEAILGYKRTYNGESVLILHNVSQNPISLEVSGTLEVANHARMEQGSVILEANGSVIIHE